MAQLGIDFSKVEATSSPEPLATGWYRAVMSESELKPTSNNATTGNELISTKFTLIDPAFKQRPVFKNFNFKNQNQQAQDIGWGEMKALNEALNIAQPNDTVEWHNKPVLIHVKLKPARSVTDPNTGVAKEYDAQNDINGFKNINDVSVQIVSEPIPVAGGNQPAGFQSNPPFVNGVSPVAVVGEPWNPTQNAQPTNASTFPQQSAPVNTAPAAATPAPIVAAPVPQPVVAAAPIYELTATGQAAAPGLTMEQWLASPGWSLDLMIKQGYAAEVKPAVQAAPAAPAAPATPAAPVQTQAAAPVQTQAAAPAQAAGTAVPPWLAGKA